MNILSALGPVIDFKRIVLFIGVIFLYKLTMWVLTELPRRVRGAQLKDIYKVSESYTLDEIREYSQDMKSQGRSDELDLVGMFILYNQTKDKYFVGADHRVFDGITWQIDGHGFINVYADIQSGDDWEVRIIPIHKTNYKNIEDMWYDGLSVFRANYEGRGYN